MTNNAKQQSCQIQWTENSRKKQQNKLDVKLKKNMIKSTNFETGETRDFKHEI